MSSNPQRFAQTVLRAFEEAGHTTDQLVAEAGGPSTTYMTGLRKAARGEEDLTEPRTDTKRRIERAALWASGSALEVWRGGEPSPQLVTRIVGNTVGRVPARGPVKWKEEAGETAFLNSLVDRVIDLEERLDDAEQRLKALESDGRRRLSAVAYEEEHSIESEQEVDDTP